MIWRTKHREIMTAIESLSEEIKRARFFSDDGKKSETIISGKVLGQSDSSGSDKDTVPRIDYIALLEERIKDLEKRVCILESGRECSEIPSSLKSPSSVQEDELPDTDLNETDEDILFPSLFASPAVNSETSAYEEFLDRCKHVYPKLLLKSEQLCDSRTRTDVYRPVNPDFGRSFHLDIQAGYDMLKQEIITLNLYHNHSLIIGEGWLSYTSWIIENLSSTNSKDQVQFITFNLSPRETEALFSSPVGSDPKVVQRIMEDYLLLNIDDPARWQELEDKLKSECFQQQQIIRNHNLHSFKDYMKAFPDHPELPHVPFLVLIVGHPDQLPQEATASFISIVRIMRSLGITMFLTGASEPVKNSLISNTILKFFISDRIGILDEHNKVQKQRYFIVP